MNGDVIERFASKSSSAVYEVKDGGERPAFCGCMGWKMSKNQPKQCRHLTDLVKDGRLGPDFMPGGSAVAPTPVAQVVAAHPQAAAGMPDLMLAHQVEKAPRPVWGDADWSMEMKLDGMRIVAVAGETQVVQYSRLGNLHDHDFLTNLRLPRGTILDGELCSDGDASSYGSGARGDARFVVFDVLAIGDQDLRAQPWTFRREALEMLVQQLDEPRVQLSTVFGVPDEAKAQELIASGHEGVMLKKRSAPYEGRRSWQMLKFKGTQTVEVVITDMDALPTAADRIAAGWKGLRYGWYVDGVLTVAGSLGMTGTPEELAPLIGRVAEVKAYAIGKTGAIRHPVFLRWRFDKRPEDCKLEVA